MDRNTNRFVVLVIAASVILSVGVLGSSPSPTADVSKENSASEGTDADLVDTTEQAVEVVNDATALVVCQATIEDSAVRVLTSPRAVNLLEGSQTNFDWSCQPLVGAAEVVAEETTTPATEMETTTPAEEMAQLNSLNFGVASAAASSNRNVDQVEDASLVVCQQSIEGTTVRALTSPQAVSLLESGNTGWSCTAMVSEVVETTTEEEETTTEEGECGECEETTTE